MTSVELSTTSAKAGRARDLLQRCCRGHFEGASSHTCERLPEAAYAAFADPGRLDPVGPLAPEVQGRLHAIAGHEVTRDNRVRLLVDGVQSYGAMLDLIENAYPSTLDQGAKHCRVTRPASLWRALLARLCWHW